MITKLSFVFSNNFDSIDCDSMEYGWLLNAVLNTTLLKDQEVYELLKSNRELAESRLQNKNLHR